MSIAISNDYGLEVQCLSSRLGSFDIPSYDLTSKDGEVASLKESIRLGMMLAFLHQTHSITFPTQVEFTTFELRESLEPEILPCAVGEGGNLNLNQYNDRLLALPYVGPFL